MPPFYFCKPGPRGEKRRGLSSPSSEVATAAAGDRPKKAFSLSPPLSIVPRAFSVPPPLSPPFPLHKVAAGPPSPSRKRRIPWDPPSSLLIRAPPPTDERSFPPFSSCSDRPR